VGGCGIVTMAGLLGQVCLRPVAGVGVGGSVRVVFSFLAELLPAHARWVWLGL
jgi:hypothetical protein